MQQGLAQGGGGRGHEHARLRLAAHEHGQGADVVEVGMGDEDGVERAVGHQAQVGQSILAFALGVHAAIEDQLPAAGFEQVTVGSDFGGAGEVGETHGNGNGNEDEK